MAQVTQDNVFSSTLLNENVAYTYHLPASYVTGDTFPIIVVLHGFNGSNHSNLWLIDKFSEAIQLGKLPDMVIILPSAKKSWYIDDYQGKYPYASMFIDEFLPYLQRTYKISSDRRRRAVMGLSMGGFGALRFAMLHPDQFGICISEQAGMSTRDQAINDDYWEKYHGGLYGEKLIGQDRVNRHFLDNNPLYIAQKLNPDLLKQTKWYLQSADDDFHSLPIAELHAVFHRGGVEHEYRVNDGKHGKKGLGDIDDRIHYLAKWLKEREIPAAP